MSKYKKGDIIRDISSFNGETLYKVLECIIVGEEECYTLEDKRMDIFTARKLYVEDNTN